MIVDLSIILIIIFFAYQSFLQGALQQICVIGGGLLGVSIGARLSIYLFQSVDAPIVRVALSVVLSLGCLLGLLMISSRIGNRARVKILTTGFYKPDKYAGAVVGVVAGLFVSWLAASLVISAHSAGMQNTVLGSRIISSIDQIKIADYSAYNIFYYIIPDKNMNIGQLQLEPVRVSPVNIASADDAPGSFYGPVSEDYESVMYIHNGACGGVGSGYVAGHQLVVTAAHVARGAGPIDVITVNQQMYTGYVVYFNTHKDTAIIYVPGLKVRPLTLDPNVLSSGQPVALLGFPAGGPFVADVGHVVSYGPEPSISGHTQANFYVADTDGQQGDSGGPIINSAGAVISHVIEGTNITNYDGALSIGVALAGDQHIDVALDDYYQNILSLEEGQNLHRVSTGYCKD
jgi:S1-C subfamily serine protease